MSYQTDEQRELESKLRDALELIVNYKPEYLLKEIGPGAVQDILVDYLWPINDWAIPRIQDALRKSGHSDCSELMQGYEGIVKTRAKVEKKKISLENGPEITDPKVRKAQKILGKEIKGLIQDFTKME